MAQDQDLPLSDRSPTAVAVVGGRAHHLDLVGVAVVSGRIVPGTMVTWESHGMGFSRRKTGTVIALIPAGVDPVEVCPELRAVPRSRVKFDLRPATVDRYVIRVYRLSRRGGLDSYYGPRADVVERAMAADKEG